jgi:hypothetical protein
LLSGQFPHFNRVRFVVRRYRTEIVIPADRYIGLHLPPDMLEGRAIVTISIVESDVVEAVPEEDFVRHDIEWWDEFEGEEAETTDEPWGLAVRLSSLET